MLECCYQGEGEEKRTRQESLTSIELSLKASQNQG